MMLHAALEAEAVVAHSCSHDVLHALSMIRQQHILRRFLLRRLMKDQLPQEGVVEAAGEQQQRQASRKILPCLLVSEEEEVVEAAAAEEEGRRSSWLPFALALGSAAGKMAEKFYRD